MEFFHLLRKYFAKRTLFIQVIHENVPEMSSSVVLKQSLNQDKAEHVLYFSKDFFINLYFLLHVTHVLLQ